MEELFQYMKTLRCQINDVADQAAKLSVEEHIHGTTIQTLQNDLILANNETKQMKEDTAQMAKIKGRICSQISARQGTITSLELETSTLSQTLDLMQHEKLSLSSKLSDRRAHYAKVIEDINGQLKEQQEWINCQKFSTQTGEDLVLEKAGGKAEYLGGMGQNKMKEFDAAKAKFQQIEQLKSNLVSENIKLKQSVKLEKSKIVEFKAELKEMDEKSLQEELQALLSDKDGEREFLQSLQLQMKKLKKISHLVNCSCGKDYNVKLDVCA